MSRVRFIVLCTGAAILLLGGCAGDGSGSAPSPSGSSASPSSSQAAVPRAEQLAAALVTAETYDGTWSVNVPPDAQSAIDGVVPESQREMLPSLRLCAKASEESRAAAEALRWQAFRQLDQSEDNPIDALRDGVRACEGEIPAGEEGPGKAESMTIPDVGEGRFGELTTVEEAGGGTYWLLHTSWVRQGPVLMNLQVVDIVMGLGVQPAFTTEDLDTFLTAAVDNLP
ncbi:hypothetical protein [Knoellia aerolata]|uniref:PknH-like extracellular domain-containing protein n=1 Tax=Knoellia aerolata DSM 18566 TaxID=1385519 RepID=A0A0A0JUQ8_9MICO|nr:hypothetical protein [Knoellia aerolata]KGN40434.1 hypothetical protein N801_08370 [Knoellia aerolata DSM 18566]